MKAEFTHAGQTRTLTKHPEVMRALAAGAITPADAARRPWYLRLKIGAKDRVFKLANLAKTDAIAEARDFLTSRERQPNEFAAWLASKDAQRSLTIGQLAADWVKLGLPFSRTKPRTTSAASTLYANLRRGLTFWDKIPVATITPTTHEDFVCWRRRNCTKGTGNRSADLELSALSSLCQWAVLDNRITKNPFEVRARFQDADAVNHCHQFAPASDEVFHALLRQLWASCGTPDQDTQTIIAGAWLAFTGLVGLRPEEPATLLRVPWLDKTPLETRTLAAGTVFPMRDGRIMMKVSRSKHGQNPFVHLHPAALDFLEHWTAWLEQHQPDALTLFPLGGIEQNTSLLNRRVTSACAVLGLTDLKPKGIGRAYYVKCRRSQGIDDAQIAIELGQSTNGKLIRSTYGDPEDLFASNAFDWLPANQETAQPEPAAWTILTQSPRRYVRYVADTSSDTSAPRQDTPTCTNLRSQETGKTAPENPICRETKPLETKAESTKPIANTMG